VSPIESPQPFNAIVCGIKTIALLDPSSIHVKSNIYAGYPIRASVNDMNQHYHSPTSTFAFPDLDQVFHGNGLESEEKAVAARRKNAEAQKMYRIRKKEHEQSLEREVNRLRQMLQESRGDLERTTRDLEHTRQELEKLKLETSASTFIPIYSPSAPVPINTSSWQAQSDVFWENGGSAQSLSPPFNLQGRPLGVLQTYHS